MPGSSPVASGECSKAGGTVASVETPSMRRRIGTPYPGGVFGAATTDNLPAMGTPPAERVTLFVAAAVCDSDGTVFRPGAVAGAGGWAVAWGEATDLRREFAGADVVECTDDLILPAFINAHAHLELSAIGPQPYGGDFIGWVRMLREHWPGDGDPWAKKPDERWHATAAKQAAMASHEAGVEHIVDISRFDEVRLARTMDAHVPGTTLVELFGIGEPYDAEALARIQRPAEGFQPHAPYSAGPSVFDAAAKSGRPVSTHLAETPDELRFVARGEGPFFDLLSRLRQGDTRFTAYYGQGLTPVQWMEPYLRQATDAGGWLVAHCNYVTDDDIVLLAETNTSVAYCPVASDYFGHRGHRYREMLDAGVNVCLGTDSVVCQPADEPQPHSVLPQMRYLYRRDRTDPGLLVRMATRNVRAWVGRDARDPWEGLAPVRVDPEDPRDILARPVSGFCHVRIDPADPTDALVQAMTSNEPGRANFLWWQA